MIKDILYNHTVFIDGRGMAGRSSSIKLPKTTVMMMEYSAGGMGGKIKIPMGMIEEMKCEINFKTFDLDVLSAMGVHMGAILPVTARGIAQDADGTKHSIIAKMRGTVEEFDPAEWKAGEEAANKIALSLRYYELVRDSREILAADPEAMVLRFGGRDVLAEDRARLAI